MKTIDKIIGGMLVLFSLVALALGVGTIIQAHGDVWDRFQSLSDAITQNLELAEQTVAVLEDNQKALDALLAPSTSTTALAGRLPSGLEQMSATLEQTAQTVDVTADTMEAMASHTGLILPGEKFGENAEALKRQGASLRQLAKTARENEEGATSMAGDLEAASAALQEVRSELNSSQITMKRVRERLKETRQVAERLDLPGQVASLVTLQGLVFILFSIVLAALAAIWLRWSRFD